MVKPDYDEIIALSEDPKVTFEDVSTLPPTSEDFERVAETADALFCQSSVAVKARVIRNWPTSVSARRLALLSNSDRNEVLSRLPADLAEGIVAVLPVGVH